MNRKKYTKEKELVKTLLWIIAGAIIASLIGAAMELLVFLTKP